MTRAANCKASTTTEACTTPNKDNKQKNVSDTNKDQEHRRKRCTHYKTSTAATTTNETRTTYVWPRAGGRGGPRLRVPAALERSHKHSLQTLIRLRFEGGRPSPPSVPSPRKPPKLRHTKRHTSQLDSNCQVYWPKKGTTIRLEFVD